MDTKRYQVQEFRDVRIPCGDGLSSLSGDLFLPVEGSPVPALVMVLPYRKDAGGGIQCDASLRWFADRGYATLLVDFRGTGSSDGQQRVPFDPSEADDAAAAIEWAAAQPWCNGSVGMWGMSYGAVMAMRTAAMGPPHLKAILPIMGMIDPERDFVHPGGASGCFASVAFWGMHTLINQLLPPLHDADDPDELKRWWRRVHHARPWLLDLWSDGPGNPAWRSRVIDPSAIVIPAFCIAGWRDLFCDAQIRAYELINAPKKLLVGPWMHTPPDVSPFQAVDYRPLALRWWNHWLKGEDTGFMEESPVTVFVQGDTDPWRRLSAWPPATDSLSFVAQNDGSLKSAGKDGHALQGLASEASEIRRDHTVGALSGLCGYPTTGFGLPVDQHDDDVRATSFTAAPGARDLVIAGRPSITLLWASKPAPGRLVARLADVDEQGRSTLISAGITRFNGSELHDIVTLHPTCYKIPRHHRLRIVLSEADFPRLWPSARRSNEGAFRLDGVQLLLPLVDGRKGNLACFDVPAEISAASSTPLGAFEQPLWNIKRDLINDGIEVCVGLESGALTPNRKHFLEISYKLVGHVNSTSSAEASVSGSCLAVAKLGTGHTVVTEVSLFMQDVVKTAKATICRDGETVFTRQWSSFESDR